MKRIAAILFSFGLLMFVVSGCKKNCPSPEPASIDNPNVYLVKYEVTFTGGTGQNQIQYIHNDGYYLTDFNQPNTWSYTLARTSGDSVYCSATSFDGTSVHVRILLNDDPWKDSFTNSGSLPFIATTDGVLP